VSRLGIDIRGNWKHGMHAACLAFLVLPSVQNDIFLRNGMS
jgi:hypothetical protein